jgi:putative flippase GtrA
MINIRKIFLYIAFAFLSSITNLGMQWIVMQAPSFSGKVIVALTAGTITGLVIKYLLDKKYIFKFTTKKKLDNARTFASYGGTGLITTPIFWGVEILATLISDQTAAQYVGGALGLSLGYICKFLLDRRFVFRSSQPSPRHP